MGCVKTPIKPNQQLCAIAQSNVSQRLGPEFRRVVAAKLLFDDRKGTYGCGIVYERVDEELAEEFDELKEAAGDNHLVSFISRVDGQPARFLEIRRSRTAPGPVSVELRTAEVTGDGYLDLFVLERAPQAGSMVDYQALKIVNGDPLLTSEIFEAALVTKTEEGAEILSSWEVDTSGERPALVIRGGSNTQSYTFAPVSRRLLPSSSIAAEKKAVSKDKGDNTANTEGFDPSDLDESAENTEAKKSDETPAIEKP